MAESARRILVVEDEMMLAMLLTDMLTDLGFEVVGPATRLEQALVLANESLIDCAILDANLNGQPSFPVADVLSKRGIPFLFATGYGKEGINETHKAATLLQKPFTVQQVKEALDKCRVE